MAYELTEQHFVFSATLDEVLVEVKDQLEMARSSDDMIRLGVRLKMASRALRCALEIYGERVAEITKEKSSGKSVQD